MEKETNKTLSILDNDYLNWIGDLKKRYRQSQIKAAIKVNSELIRFYWELGRDIVNMKSEARWGKSFIDTLSRDLKKEFSDSLGFSPRNLRLMRQFYELFPTENFSQESTNQIWQHLAAKIFGIPWGHMCLIISKVRGNQEKAIFYINQTIEHNWSRSILLNFLDTDLYERSGKSVNNFEVNLSSIEKDLAKEITKNPYNFNFLSLDKDYSEKELKDALILNIQKFLTELGTGFAYMGREFRLEVGNTEIFIDMLFYNTKVHAYVVIEVKVTDFKSDYVGQLGTYVVAVDNILKTDRDEKTIGILICKWKDDVLARYSLNSSSQPLGISDYELSRLIPDNFKSSLPSVEEIEIELKRNL